jgi:hypothetical protein
MESGVCAFPCLHPLSRTPQNVFCASLTLAGPLHPSLHKGSLCVIHCTHITYFAWLADFHLSADVASTSSSPPTYMGAFSLCESEIEVIEV